MNNVFLSNVAVALMIFAGYAIASDGDALPDPTRPLGRAEAPHAGGGLVLQSTIVSPGRRVAVINGRARSIGEKAGNAVITDITPYEVVLSDGGREKRLRLLPKLHKGKTGGRSHEGTE